MKFWQFTDSRQFNLYQTDNEQFINPNYPAIHMDRFDNIIENSDKVNVKVIKANLTASDLSSFLGKCKYYPIIPGRSAVAYISDNNNPSFRQGERVYLSPYKVMENGHVKVSGVHINGYLGNYLSIDKDMVYSAPEGVSEDELLYTEDIALCINVLNKLNIEKGEYLLIYGASYLNCIIAQLAIYYQAIPVIIDNNARRLDLATQCRVYYTIDTNSEIASVKINEITAGKLMDKAIIDCDTFPNVDEIMPFIKFNGSIALYGYNYFANQLTCNLNRALTHELTIVGVHNGATEIHSALNILANKVLKLQNFKNEIIHFNDFIQGIKTAADKTNYYKNIVLID